MGFDWRALLECRFARLREEQLEAAAMIVATEDSTKSAVTEVGLTNGVLEVDTAEFEVVCGRGKRTTSASAAATAAALTEDDVE